MLDFEHNTVSNVLTTYPRVANATITHVGDNQYQVSFAPGAYVPGAPPRTDALRDAPAIALSAAHAC